MYHTTRSSDVSAGCTFIKNLIHNMVSLHTVSVQGLDNPSTSHNMEMIITSLKNSNKLRFMGFIQQIKYEEGKLMLQHRHSTPYKTLTYIHLSTRCNSRELNNSIIGTLHKNYFLIHTIMDPQSSKLDS